MILKLLCKDKWSELIKLTTSLLLDSTDILMFHQRIWTSLLDWVTKVQVIPSSYRQLLINSVSSHFNIHEKESMCFNFEFYFIRNNKSYLYQLKTNFGELISTWIPDIQVIDCSIVMFLSAELNWTWNVEDV
jgi:hypothetical protein